MAATLTRLARTLPLPLFGSAQTAASFTLAKSRILPRLLGWTVPLTIGGLWFVWPAVDDGWKIEMGIMSDPEAALAAASSSSSSGEETKVELSEEAQAKVENAYKAHEVEVTEDDKLLAKAADSGDFTYLEEKWEEFNEKAIRPGEDDDEDDDDDDDDDDEEDEDDDEEDDEE